MNLISILIALAVETLYRPVSSYRRYDWLMDLSSRLYQNLSAQSWRDTPAGVILMVALPCLAVWLISAMLAGVTSLFGFLFGLLVLIYCIGPRDLLDDVHRFAEAVRADDTETARALAGEILGQEVEGDREALAIAVRDAIPLAANTRVLGILFWFMIMGPVGAVLFRYACLLRHESGWSDGFTRSLERLHEILLWPSARLSVIGFALVGSFVDTISNWQSAADFWQRDSEELLRLSGLGAIRHELDEDAEEGTAVEAVHSMLALMKRTLIIWLVILALLTLTGQVL